MLNFFTTRRFVPVILSLLLPVTATRAQTWVTVWSENFNNRVYESCYGSGGSTYWANCASPAAGPRNSLINGTWEVSNTNLGSTQNPKDAAGGRFLMYWSDNLYNSGANVPAGDNIIFSKTLTGLTIGKSYRISYKAGSPVLIPNAASNPPSIGLNLNGSTVLSPTTATISWVSRTYTWIATGTSMTLAWTNSVKAVNGNDIGLDDILVEVFMIITPVTLTDFRVTAREKTAELNWTTAMEQNNTGFEVQRSNDGNNWSTLDFVKSKNPNSNNSTHYSFTDMDPVNGDNYYRLKQIDLDGRYTFSPIQKARFNFAGNTISISPNPVGDRLNMIVKDHYAVNSVVLLDQSGRRVYRNEGFQNNIDVSRLARGIYFLQVSFKDGEMRTERIMKR